MATESKSLNYLISTLDLEIINDCLEEKRKKSDKTYFNVKSKVYDCLNYIQKPLSEIKTKDVKEYFKYLDSLYTKFVSKETYRSRLKAFFEYVVDRLDEEDIEIRNPIPSKRVFSFSKSELDFKEDDTIPFSNEELAEILELSKKRDLRDFIIFGLLICCGMRISECLTIRIENIDIGKRRIKTGMTKNARKSNKVLTFFIPKNFAKYLDHYITLQNRVSGYLFQGKSTHYSYTGFYTYVERNFMKKYCEFHRFRKTLITNRIKMGCELWKSEGLTNHKVSDSTQRKYYIKLTDSEKRALYDLYNPYSHLTYF